MARHMVEQIRGMQGKRGKVEKVLHEFKEGTLRSSSGPKVVKRSQAIAIAMSEAGLSKRKGKKRTVRRKRGK